MKLLEKLLEKLGLREASGFFEGSGAGQVSSISTPANLFKRRLECFLKDPDTYVAVMALTAFVVGPGFHVSGRREAVELVNEFNRRVGMDQILFKAISEMLWAGNSFWLKIHESGRLTGLRHIPLPSITAIHRSDLEIKAIEVRSITGETVKLDFNDVVHFYFIKHGDEVLGSPINRPLLEERVVYDPDRNSAYTVPSYYDIKWSMEWAMWKVLMKYPPRHIYQFPKIGGEAQREYAEKIKQMLPGEDIVTNQEVRVIDVKMDPRARFDAYIEYLDNKVTIGLMNSVLRLFTKPGFTEASAREANRLQGNIVSAIQRSVKRIVENQIYDPLLRSHGIDPGEAGVRFNWGMPEKPKITLGDVQKFYSTPPHIEPALTREEVRKILKNLGFPITDEEASIRVAESARSIVIQLRGNIPGDFSSLREVVVDRKRGISLTMLEGSGEPAILAATFDKEKWPWNAEKARTWVEENLELMKAALAR
ncbi:MAG: hypothetical protein J7J94_03505 [Thaumarchaeota archaeon]|nr:hypothetical protein [Nitrososphaerota archaeon]